MNIAVTFSTLSGNTALVAQRLAEHLQQKGHAVDTVDLISANPDDFKNYDLVIFGSSTYGEGGLNPISEIFFELADSQNHDCQHTKFAFFSLGDSSYANFSTSGQITSEKIKAMHGCVVGDIYTIDGYPEPEVIEGVQSWADGVISELG